MDSSGRIQRIWYEGAPVPFWLAALEPVYRVLHAATQARRARDAERVGVRVVVVGNVVAGGAGKTPLVIALVEALRARGFAPGVASRGYGGRERGPLRLGATPDPVRVGDEPTLIRRRTGAEVAIGRDRVAAARLLVASGVDVVVADDGLQNPRLARDVEICVIDGERRFGNGRMLPAGPLRDPPQRLARVDFTVLNGGQPREGEVPMRLIGESAVPLAGDTAPLPLAAFAGRRVHAVAGIGNPDRFFSALRAHGIEVVAHPFPDHHACAASDFAFGDDAPVLMTEKDAVKCIAFADTRMWHVPVRAELPECFFDAVAARIGAAAG